MGDKLKLHKSVLEQIEHLKARGVLIDDECNAEFFLSNVNYYRFSGYLYEFRSQDLLITLMVQTLQISAC